MPRPDPPERASRDPEMEKVMRVAARLFLRLRDDPNDAEALKERDAFLARGEAERRAYARVSRATTAAARGETARKGRLLVCALLGGVLASLALSGERLRIAVMADYRTQAEQVAVTLESGDIATLDAASALADHSSGAERRVTLMSGAGFFDVDQTGRRFIVTSGALEAEALGTRFEVSQLGDTVLVTVEEGHVEVRDDTRIWQLFGGQRLFWRNHGSEHVEDTDITQIAGWRADRLDLTGVTFGEVVDVIERRLPGRVYVPNALLYDVQLSGGLDLTDPYAALEGLAEAQNARIVFSNVLGSLIVPK